MDDAERDVEREPSRREGMESGLGRDLGGAGEVGFQPSMLVGGGLCVERGRGQVKLNRPGEGGGAWRMNESGVEVGRWA